MSLSVLCMFYHRTAWKIVLFNPPNQAVLEMVNNKSQQIVYSICKFQNGYCTKNKLVLHIYGTFLCSLHDGLAYILFINMF